MKRRITIDVPDHDRLYMANRTTGDFREGGAVDILQDVAAALADPTTEVHVSPRPLPRFGDPVMPGSVTPEYVHEILDGGPKHKGKKGRKKYGKKSKKVKA